MKTRIFHLTTFIVLFGGVVLWFSYFGFNLINKAESSLTDNVTGWGWSDNIGWISTNCTDSNCAGTDYGVNVNTTTGEVTGTMWSDNIGWISFDRTLTNNPPEEPFKSGSGQIAHFDQSSKQVTGWARAISGCQDNPLIVANTCNSTGAGLASGGWDGWIKLYNVKFDETTGKLDGWAWGSDVVGWVNFNSSSIPAPVITSGSNNVTGWGWSDNIGWVSTNCSDYNCNSTDYGVNVNTTTGEVTGTMWSDNIGWISFDRTVTSDPILAPFSAGPGRIAEYNPSTKKITGWARAISGCQDNPLVVANTCNSTGAGLASGGWDGWINLYDIEYTGIGLKGWMWGSDVVGWISFDSPTIASGTISAGNCIIPKNDSSCVSKVTWTSENFTGGTSLTQGSNEFSVDENNIAGVDRIVSPNDRTFTLKEVGGIYTISKVASVSCESGSSWDASAHICKEIIFVPTPDEPEITITANPPLVRSGQKSQIEVNITSAEVLSCTVDGVDPAGLTFTHDGLSTPIKLSSFTTKALTSAQIVKVKCVVSTFPSVSTEKEVRVNVMGNSEEL